MMLERGRVDVWRIALDAGEREVDRMRTVLSADEAERAARLRVAADHDLYVLARGLLRTLLGRALDADPRSVAFDLGDHGKPALADAPAASGLRFSVSHSGSVACVALTLDADVGVDVERVKPGIGGTGLAERFFAPIEVAALRAVPQDAMDEAFVRCWTRKEAYIKALGTGLSEPLDGFAVSLDDRPGLLWVEGRPDEPRRWTFGNLDVGDGYAGAVAVRSAGAEVACRAWAGDERRSARH